MKENKFNQKLGKDLRAYFHPRGEQVFKHNDFYTAGVPDFSVTWGKDTTWFECKVIPNDPTALQADCLKRLIGSFVIEVSADGNWHNIISLNGLEDELDLSYDQLLKILIERITFNEFRMGKKSSRIS